VNEEAKLSDGLTFVRRGKFALYLQSECFTVCETQMEARGNHKSEWKGRAASILDRRRHWSR